MVAEAATAEGERMNWTTEAPTESGWYWAWNGRSVELCEVCPPSSSYLKHRLWVYAVKRRRRNLPMSGFSHWLGPLPAPSSPVAGDIIEGGGDVAVDGDGGKFDEIARSDAQQVA